MTRIVDTKTNAVTLGVMDKNLQVHEELGQVTFDDVFGTRHTVQYHQEGPFGSPEDVVQAHQDGILHPFKDHETAAAYEQDRGNHEVAERLRSLSGGNQGREQPNQGGGY